MENVSSASTSPTHIETLIGHEMYPSWKREMEDTLYPSQLASIIQEVNTAQWLRPLTQLQTWHIDPSHWRACAQSYHHTTLEKSFLWSVHIHRNASGAKTLDIPLQFHERVTKPIADMDGDDARQFCYKDCAIYQNVSFGKPFVEMDIFEKVYAKWWPGRFKGEDIIRVGPTGVNRHSFWGKYMNFSPPGVELTEVVAFHAELAQKLKELAPEVLAAKVLAFDPRYGMERERGLYSMMGTFEEVFVVLDRVEWETEGVSCVFRDGETAGRFGLDDGERDAMIEVPEQEMGQLESGNWSKPSLLRVSLERAVEIVAGRDEERRKRGKRSEWNDMKEQFLGGEGEGES